MTSVQRIDNRLADTALMVAVCRAIASDRGVHDLDDPYSKAIVAASGVPYWISFLESGESLLSQRSDFALKARAMLGHVVARTRYIDSVITDSFRSAGVQGIRPQLVILGAGFDTRAARLECLREASVYEVDIDDVARFKTDALDAEEFRGKNKPILVGADLAGDWLPRLVASGWNSSTPTFWLAEGLLGYLHGHEQEKLLGVIGEHSAPGSIALFEYASVITTNVESDINPAMVEQFAGDDDGMLPDLTSLIRVERRTPPDEYLRTLGWHSTIDDGEAVYTTWFREVEPAVQASALSGQFATKFIISRNK